MSEDQTPTPAQDNTDAGAVDQTKTVEPGSTLTTPIEGEKAPVEGEKAPVEGEKAPEGDKTIEGAPEAYADFTAPEGVNLDPGMVSKFSEAAKELNLSQPNAQKLMDLASEHVQGLTAQAQKSHNDMRDTWVSELKADEDFGGAKFTETVERAQRALAKFGSPELNSFLAKTGAGDNNEVVKMFARIGTAMGEDKFVDGGANGSAKSAAEIIYG